jgi:hypothetical protein
MRLLRLSAKQRGVMLIDDPIENPAITNPAEPGGEPEGPDGPGGDIQPQVLTLVTAAELSGGDPPSASGQVSDRKRAANRANSLLSTGPRTEAGKERSRLNGLKRRPVRLMGLAESRTLNQEPLAAEELYQELIEPFEPVPALVARHFQDLARLYLELEAWERIRDAQLEDRWQHGLLERRRLFYAMDRDLKGGLKEVLERGLASLEDSGGKFKKQAVYLGALQEHLKRREFDALAPILQTLYGKDLNPGYDRAQTICIRCERLMNPGRGEPVSEAEFQNLQELVEAEEQEAMTAYGLHLDEKTMTRQACLSQLGPTRQDYWMDRRGEHLRQAIDRKQWLILGLLQALGLANSCRPKQQPKRRKTAPSPPKKSTKRSQEVVSNQQKHAKKGQKRSQPKPPRPPRLRADR